MLVDRDKIVKFCEDYLKTANFEDYCHNGLQIEGADKINKIVVGVSLSEQLIRQAINKKAKMIIVHHGFFVKQIPSPIQLAGITKTRIKLLLENDINLCGFHLPLDAHPIIGNNISLCRLLGVKDVSPFDVGFIGNLKQTIKFDDFANLVKERLDTNLDIIAAGPKKVKKIAIISGGASPEHKIAAELGADVFLCGDIREGVVREIEEEKINFINAGHYNTEKLGIHNLGKLIAKKFKIKVEFIDIPNKI